MGAGRHLLAAAIGAMLAAGVRRLFLEVAVDNAPAIGLYRAFGFTDEGRRRFFEYINVLETVVHDAMTAARDVSPPAPNKVNLADGWSPA